MTPLSVAVVLGGRFLNGRDVEQKRRVLFLGDEIAERLFPGGSAIGETVTVDGWQTGVDTCRLGCGKDAAPHGKARLLPGQ